MFEKNFPIIETNINKFLNRYVSLTFKATGNILYIYLKRKINRCAAIENIRCIWQHNFKHPHVVIRSFILPHKYGFLRKVLIRMQSIYVCIRTIQGYLRIYLNISHINDCGYNFMCSSRMVASVMLYVFVELWVLVCAIQNVVATFCIIKWFLWVL